MSDDIDDSIIRYADDRFELRSYPKYRDLLRIVSNDFHDRFWIADHARGIVVGTSLNQIGSKIFLVDELSKRDINAILDEPKALALDRTEDSTFSNSSPPYPPSQQCDRRCRH